MYVQYKGKEIDRVKFVRREREREREREERKNEVMRGKRASSSKQGYSRPVTSRFFLFSNIPCLVL